MAVDRFGLTEDIADLDPDAIRFCFTHKLPHDPDPIHYHGAGRTCPAGGEPLVGYLARFREADGTPSLGLPDAWDYWSA
jgi:hypothetical protein